MNIRKRVTVLTNDSAHVPFFAHREQAAAMLGNGTAVIETVNDSGFVTAIRLSVKGAPKTAVAGSFGLRWERLETGRKIHQHRPAGERPVIATVSAPQFADNLADRSVLPLITYHPASLTTRNGHKVTIQREKAAIPCDPRGDVMREYAKRNDRQQRKSEGLLVPLKKLSMAEFVAELKAISKKKGETI